MGNPAEERGPLSIAWLGHSTVVIDLDGIRLITDPLLGEPAGLPGGGGRDRTRGCGRDRTRP